MGAACNGGRKPTRGTIGAHIIRREDVLVHRVVVTFLYRRIGFLLFWLLLQALPSASAAQDANTARSAEPLRVFLDCSSCDFDYLRREVPFVAYVRDRKEAELHILVITQPTGGGTEYTFKFIGLGRFQGIDDELKYDARQTQTGDERRQGYAEVLKLGLVRYVTSTSIGDRLRLVYRPDPGKNLPGTIVNDPWNFWSFRVRGSGAVSGESTTGARNLSSSIIVNRTTEEWKVNLNGNLNFHTGEFQLSGGETLVDRSHDHSLGGIVVRSLGPHWALATRGRLASTTFLNQAQASRIGGGIEYDVFPYSESSHRELTLQLTSNVNHFEYIEPTIYGRMSETAGDAALVGAFDVRQPWGSCGLSVETATYLAHLDRHRLVAAGNLDLRLFKGFALSLDGAASRINDQLYLAAGQATDEEILLRRRQQATTYRYHFSIGLSYTFGSIFNNVVNTRF
jgi:hypothetical protein